MNDSQEPLIRQLIGQGVQIAVPSSVQIDADVDPARIAAGVVIHPGCRIRGAKTAIGPGCELGRETPLTLEDCVLGADVQLDGGFCAGSVFLDGSSVGSGAHVRPGCLLEEQASGAHTVGFKQTLLMSFVTAGSLINFCDALMAGGTSRKNHSEVGSSFIHFNFTPHGDKATASLIGDVPRGVMLDQSPIFLGGQGGLVGPVRFEYGCVLPAGTIYRRDALEPDRLLVGQTSTRARSVPYKVGALRRIQRRVMNNFIYIGNLLAMKAWYSDVRVVTMDTPHGRLAREAALAVLDHMVEERVKRLDGLVGKLPDSIAQWQAQGEDAEAQAQQSLVKAWPKAKDALWAAALEVSAEQDAFLAAWQKHAVGRPHVEAVQALPLETKQQGTAWLQRYVDWALGMASAIFE